MVIDQCPSASNSLCYGFRLSQMQRQSGFQHCFTSWSPVSLLMLTMQAVCGTQQIQYQGQTLDLAKPFRRATMHELVHEGLGESDLMCAF